MAKVTIYKNSKFASFLSILGNLVIVGGVYAIFNDALVGGCVALVIGIGFKLLAGFISQKKSKKDAELMQG